MTHFLTTHIAQYGYLAVFVLMLLESACIPVPSEVVMLFGGALAGGLLASGGNPHVTLVGVALVGAAGNVVGSLIVYGIGRAVGPRLVERGGLSWLVRPRHLQQAQAFFARRGRSAVFVGRLLPVIRTFISLPAGVARMPLVPFTVYTAAGCLPWTFALTAVGYGLAAHWDRYSRGFTAASAVVAVLAVAGLAVWWRRTARTRTKEQIYETLATAEHESH